MPEVRANHMGRKRSFERHDLLVGCVPVWIVTQSSKTVIISNIRYVVAALSDLIGVITSSKHTWGLVFLYMAVEAAISSISAWEWCGVVVTTFPFIRLTLKVRFGTI